MSVRRAIIDANVDELNVTEFCRSHGVSTWFFYDLRRRYLVEGDAVLTPKSRAPHRPAGRTPVEVEDAIVAKRKELDDHGLDNGAASIAFYLRDLPGLPSESTIWRILVARGQIVPQPAKAPKPKGRSYTAKRANECWPLDDTPHRLDDGTIVKILNVLDDHSRYAVASVAMPTCTGARSFSALSDAAVWLGWPQRVWSDNARAFKHVLADALRAVGVDIGHPRPYHPEGNGKIERFHQTQAKWLAKQPAASTLGALQTQLDAFRTIYNDQRPHRGIERRRPTDVWVSAPKTGPAERPIGTPTIIHESTVIEGRVSAGRYDITIGAAHNNQHARTIITGNACHVFIDGRLARQLITDPTRRLQPLHPRPGNPSTTTKRNDPRHA